MTTIDAKHESHPHIIAHSGYDLFRRNQKINKKINDRTLCVNLPSIIRDIRIEQNGSDEYKLKGKGNDS